MKHILIFNDISGIGNCSMSANLPIFSKLGHYCMPVVTANYSCQTGFDNFAVLPNGRVKDFAARICEKHTPDACYVGFCNDIATLQAVDCVAADLLKKDVCLFVDPIMGDNGKLYPVFDVAYAEKIKSLVRKANAISPNLTEACILADVDYGALMSRRNEGNFLQICAETFSDFLHICGAEKAVITGVDLGEYIGNIVLEDGTVRFVTNEKTPIDYSGTGDVFSSALFGKMLCGCSFYDSAVAAARFVCSAARNTACADRRFGVEFCRVLNELI